LSIKDEDIDISLPEEHDLGFSNAALKFHVKMARLEGMVVSGTAFSHRNCSWLAADCFEAAYRINGTVDKSFVAGIQDVFSSMVNLAEDLQGEFDLSLQSSSMVSRVAATLHIMFYQVWRLALTESFPEWLTLCSALS
jgi:hypothetical protein